MPKSSKAFDLFDDTIVRSIDYQQRVIDVRDSNGMIASRVVDHTEFTANGIKDDATEMLGLQGKEITVSGKSAIVDNIDVCIKHNGFPEYTITGRIYGKAESTKKAAEAHKKAAEEARRRAAEEEARRLREEELERNRVKTRIIRLRKYRKKKTGQK